jgi:hypothetical protein
VGLGSNAAEDDDESKMPLTTGMERGDMIGDILCQIIEPFEATEVASRRLKTAAIPSAKQTSDKNDIHKSIDTKMWNLAIRRRGLDDLKRRTYWASSGSGSLASMVEGMNSLFTALIELFPDTKAAQKMLCEVEVAEVSTEEGIEVLTEAVNEGRHS